MKSVTVFCGASKGIDQHYELAAKSLGTYLAKNNIDVVFGGGRIGIMGIVADATIAAGGKVIGVIPRFLRTKEVAHAGLTEMHVVSSMHERKMLMHKISDGVIALPGGFGTLDELFEMLTWSQLGLHAKPIALLNTNGYFNHLIQFIEHMCSEGFLSETNRNMLLVSDDIEMLMAKIMNYTAPDVPKWLNEGDE